MRDNNCDYEGEPLHALDTTSALARQHYRDFDYDEPSIELPVGNDLVVHVFGEHLDVAIIGGADLEDERATAEREIRERYCAITALTDNVDVVFTTRPGEGMLELPLVSYY